MKILQVIKRGDKDKEKKIKKDQKKNKDNKKNKNNDKEEKKQERSNEKSENAGGNQNIVEKMTTLDSNQQVILITTNGYNTNTG